MSKFLINLTKQGKKKIYFTLMTDMKDSLAKFFKMIGVEVIEPKFHACGNIDTMINNIRSNYVIPVR